MAEVTIRIALRSRFKSNLRIRIQGHQTIRWLNSHRPLIMVPPASPCSQSRKKSSAVAQEVPNQEWWCHKLIYKSIAVRPLLIAIKNRQVSRDALHLKTRLIAHRALKHLIIKHIAHSNSRKIISLQMLQVHSNHNKASISMQEGAGRSWSHPHRTSSIIPPKKA